MKLDADSHERIEGFMREHFNDQGLKLPPISVYCGPVARVFTKALAIGAITFGRRIFVSQNHLRKDAQGRAVIPGWLAVHEATHVLQYERLGYVGFFISYLGGYWRALREMGKWDRAARNAAYFKIKEECEAHDAERAYRQNGMSASVLH